MSRTFNTDCAIPYENLMQAMLVPLSVGCDKFLSMASTTKREMTTPPAGGAITGGPGESDGVQTPRSTPYIRWDMTEPKTMFGGEGVTNPPGML